MRPDGWSSFCDVADDDVICLAACYLEPADLLGLVTSSASTFGRIVSEGEPQSGSVRPSVARRFATLLLGAEEVTAAALATVNGALPPLLRALAGETPESGALCSALQLARSSDSHEVVDGGPFLTALFRLEESAATRDGTSGPALAARASLALLLTSDGPRNAVSRAAAAAVRQAEKQLDMFVDGLHTSVGQRSNRSASYEAVARLRSAAEFLRGRLDAGVATAGPATPQSAREELDVAVRSLDDAIAGYIEEGYDFCCPSLCRRFVMADSSRKQFVLPYSHWWVWKAGNVRCEAGSCG
eukprot:gnl/TRDRNA2_/TRDRNA2_28771_c0_seq1.p1 gnl/TRDRNA2_/TRDRNA2_28771_c0~~gnl/TRDRNA2_/TRDRNA2_28771_c0_seq1.p1  ORF type:complete len:312 (+),score=51.27 gnl/TRDRNA2_/TRDRNA2_28771_c0_seq1:38-937(+)